MSESEGFILKAEQFNQEEWCEMFIRVSETCKDLRIENEHLQNQLQQKENIIKEVREYILTHKLYCFEYDEEELFEIVTDKKAKDELLEILDKVD